MSPHPNRSILPLYSGYNRGITATTSGERRNIRAQATHFGNRYRRLNVLNRFSGKRVLEVCTERNAAYTEARCSFWRA